MYFALFCYCVLFFGYIKLKNYETKANPPLKRYLNKMD